MSLEGNLAKIKQIFSFVDQENINVEEMEVENNVVNNGKKPRLVDTNCGCIPTDGCTPLITAACSRHHQVCEYLITKQKANLEEIDDHQATVLIHAVDSMVENTELIKLLLKNNANVKAQDIYGRHAAYIAASNGYLNALKMLVENDEDMIDLKRYNGKTLLIAAIESRRVDVCKYLVVEKNANVDLKDNEGKTALQCAYDYALLNFISNQSFHEIIEIFKKGLSKSESQYSKLIFF